MTEIQNNKLVWVIEKLRYICNLVPGTWDLIDGPDQSRRVSRNGGSGISNA
jgi:hypothetical protein